MNDQRTTIFPAVLRIRMPETLFAALDQAAAQRQTTRSEFVRQALIDRLREDGFLDNGRVAMGGAR